MPCRVQQRSELTQEHQGGRDNTMEGKRMTEVYQTDAMRDLIKFMNKEGIQKEDVVSIFQDARTDEFVIIYYK